MSVCLAATDTRHIPLGDAVGLAVAARRHDGCRWLSVRRAAKFARPKFVVGERSLRRTDLAKAHSVRLSRKPPSTFGPSPRQISPHNNTRHGSLRRSSRRYALCVLEGFQEAWLREFAGRLQSTQLIRMSIDPALHLPPPVQGRRHR